MTRAEIQARILSGLNESTTAPAFVSTTEVADLIDEAAEVLAEELGAVRRTVFVEQRPGAMYYSLHGLGQRIIAPYRIWDHAREYRLPAVTYDDLDKRMRNWPTATGQPACWFPVSWDIFGLWPRASAGGGLLQIDCTAWPRVLMDDNDEPEMLASDLDALTAYGIYGGALKRWDSDSAALAWKEFAVRFGEGRGRAGAALEARTWQRAQAGQVGLRSGIERI